MSPYVASLVALASLAAIVTGVFMLGGLPVALIVGGVVGFAVTIVAVDPSRTRKTESTAPQGEPGKPRLVR